MARIPFRALTPMLSLAALLALPYGPPAAHAGDRTPAASTPARSAMGELMGDGTRTAHWTLGNGLRVVTRHIPGAHSTAVTLSFRLGSREDPATREGLAELAGQVAFTGRCGDVPARSTLEMDQLRPGGWSLKVGPYLTEMTEACPAPLLPGVLRQVCQRLRGVVVNDSLMSRSRREVARRLRNNYNLRAGKTLYFLTGEMAAGRPVETAMRYATGEALGAIASRDVAALLGERLVPANTVLCVVGNLEGLDLRALVEREAGSIAAGKSAPPPPWGATVPAAADLERPDIKLPVGTVAVLAPALTDTMHAYFTAFTISAAGSLSRTWSAPEPPLARRFDYSVAVDPELARFYPPVTSEGRPDLTLTAVLGQNAEVIADSSAIRVAAESMQWLTGGNIPGDLLKRSRTDPTVIHTLATILAALESYGDEAFWSAYRGRLSRAHTLDMLPFLRWYADPKHLVLLVLRPGH